MKSAGVTVIVPCYNEEHRFPSQIFLNFAEREKDFNFLLVDDGSLDQTAAVLNKMSAAMPDRFRVLVLGNNAGKAEAVRRGVVEALKSSPHFVAYWDADLATPLDMLPVFLKTMNERLEVEIILGSRVKLLGWDIQRQPVRHYLGRVFATVASSVLQLHVYDTQCGAKMFRVTDFIRDIWQEPFISRWIFDVELLARYLNARGLGTKEAELHIYEQPLPRWVDVQGSKVKPGDFFKAFAELINIYFRYKAGK